MGRFRSCSFDHAAQSGSRSWRSDAVTSCVREGCIDTMFRGVNLQEVLWKI